MILAPQPRTLEETAGRCPLATLEAQCTIDPASVAQAQGYTLDLKPDAVHLVGHDDAGVFYGRQTLAQLRRQVDGDGAVPCLHIEDWPDLPVRGFMLDVSRDRVPTMQTLLALIDTFALLKYNQFQLYTEHTFAYAGHEKVWKDASPFTPDEIRQIDDYCAERFIELVPNQNCFGHLERWLKHEPYRQFAECPDGFIRDDLPEPFFSPEAKTLDPLDSRSLELVEDMLAQLLPCFRSDTINIGCDETFDLGKGKSKSECERVGKGRVYLDFVRKVYDVCTKHGKQVQYWGDIILHSPELLPAVKSELPGAMALNWGYELNHPFDKENKAFHEAGLPYMVCPANATFVGIGGRWDVAIGNAVNAVESGLKFGTSGMLNTWWGDFGHWQPHAVNHPGIVMGAAASWCLETNRGLDVAAALDTLIYEDAGGRLAGAVREMGRLRDDLDCNRENVLGWAMIRDEVELRDDGYLKMPWGATGPLTHEKLDAAQQRLESALAGVALADPKRADAALLLDELRVAGRMLHHSLANLRGRLEDGVAHSTQLSADRRAALLYDMTAIIPEFETNWRQRSRPGGLTDSVAALHRICGHYRGDPGC